MAAHRTSADRTSAQPRPYRMRKRRDAVDSTRRRIVEAAVDLHVTVGPAATTVSAVAERAGVQRSTVYRHFPDDDALYAACTSHWRARHPRPNPDAWRGLADGHARLGRGLFETYRYYEENEQMLVNSHRDAGIMPRFVMETIEAETDAAVAVLLEPFGESVDPVVTAVVTHAVDFRTWRSLSDAGLGVEEAAQAMTTMVSAVSAPSEALPAAT